jgi:hypothetical protein
MAAMRTCNNSKAVAEVESCTVLKLHVVKMCKEN